MKKNSAFSLIEILLVIVIMAIFLGIAVPSLFYWVKSSQIKTDTSICLEMEKIITNAVKSKDIEIDKTDYSILWTLSNKAKIRTILSRQMQSSPKVTRPKENGYTFFVYLLPPYSVICLPINSSEYIDTDNLAFDQVTNEFLLERYPKSHYPQMYNSSYSDETKSVGTPTLIFPVAIKPDDLVSIDKNSQIGCINLPTDYDN